MQAAAQTRVEPNWTVGSILSWATGDFSARGIPNSRLDAEVLLAHALGTNRVGLYLQFDRPLTEDEKDQFRNLIQDRRKGKPVAYILGEKEFYSLPLYVDSRVLIPRPETELLVDEVLSWAKKENRPLRICDVGTGSGAIAIAIKKNLLSAEVMGIDFGDALEVARKNGDRHEVSIEWRESNLLENVGNEPFDAIVANLPYIPTQECDELSMDVRDFEPRVALDGGIQGLDLIFRLIEEASQRFPKARLFLEMGLGQKEGISRYLHDRGYSLVTLRNDIAGIPRIVVAGKEETCR